MTVLHLHSGNLFGGIERVLITLARHRHLQPALRHCFAVCFTGALQEALCAAGVPPLVLGAVRASRPLGVLAARRALVSAEIARRQEGLEGADIVICHSPWALALFGPAVRVSGLPLVLWLHGDVGGSHWVDRWAARVTPDLIICNSRFTVSTTTRFESRIPRAVLYCPSEPPDASGPEDRALVRAELETPADALVVIQVSRMEPGKGQAAHVGALARLRHDPRWVCWMVGGTQRPFELRYMHRLKQLATEAGIADRVRFLGERRDVARLLAAADIYCQPCTRPEGFGLSLAEALHAGLPVVTTALGGVQELVDRSCALLVEPGTVEGPALSDALARLLGHEDLRRRLGAAGSMRARRLTDVHAHMDELARLLTRTIEARSPVACPA